MFRNRVPFFVAALAFATLAYSCSGGSDTTAESSPAQSADSQAAPIPEGMFVGQVTETMDAGGYTYVQLEQDGKSLWAAGPSSQVAVGEELAVTLAMPMQGFRSETLDRTFDTVYFVGGFERLDHANASGGTNGAHGMGTSTTDYGSQGNPHGQDAGMAANAGVDLSGISKPSGGQTVAELFSSKSGFAGKEVSFRGRVVKYNSGIMGRNWLHVQDGTGDASAASNDITVTTEQTAKVGDLVLVRGVVALDKDFGAGYKYDLIVENASVDVESGGK